WPLPINAGFPFHGWKTDEHGDVIFTAAAGRQHWLQASVDDRCSELLRVDFKAGDPPLAMTLLPPGAERARGTLAISVVDSEGHPMPNMPVNLMPDPLGGSLFSSLRTSLVSDVSGQLHVPDVWPAAWNVGSKDLDRGFGFSYVAVPAGEVTRVIVVAR